MRKVIVLEFVTLDGVIQAGGTMSAAFKVTESVVTSSGIIIANYARAGGVTTGSLG